MRPFIIIRSYTKNDDFEVQDLIKRYVMSGANSAFITCLFREITLQLIVLTTAILFIFFGVPLLGCAMFGLPGVILFMYISVHASFYNKAMECINVPGGNKQCWVAEVYEPFVLQLKSTQTDFTILEENNFDKTDIEINKMKRKIVGTINVKNHNALHNTGWIYRLTADPQYPFATITEALIQKVLDYCAEQDLYSCETVTNECQEKSREVLTNIGFTIKQIYSQNILGCIRVMKAQMGIDLSERKLKN